MKYLVILLIVVWTAACAQAPKAVILNPTFTGQHSNALPLAINLQVDDKRITKFTAKVKGKEPAAYLPDANLPLTIQALIKEGLNKQGSSIMTDAAAEITLEIHEFKAVINETYSKHQSDAVAKFTVKARINGKRFSKDYQGNAKLNGPLVHSQAKVERQLNKLADQMISRVVSDPALHQFLRS